MLMANRHACCVCQAFQVQLHHIDENPANNVAENLAVLCLHHHDQASMQIGLTKKLKATEIRKYKVEWEEKCAADIQALARHRLRFYAAVYKNPPRIRELFSSLTQEKRASAVARLEQNLQEDSEQQKTDASFQLQAVSGDNSLTRILLPSLLAGELWPTAIPASLGMLWIRTIRSTWPRLTACWLSMA